MTNQACGNTVVAHALMRAASRLISTPALRWIAAAVSTVVLLTAQQTPPAAGGRGAGRAGRGAAPAARGITALEEAGFKQIFDGKTLTGWDCDPEFWRVENGAMVGETKAGHQPKQNVFCIWRGGTGGDFELKLEYKMTGGNSGIQYRSIERPDVNRWVLQGYQADMDAAQQYTGQIYEERGRQFLTMRGQVTYIPDGKTPETRRPGMIGSLGDPNELKALIKNEDWNAIHIIARGNTIIQIVNGRAMAVLIDDDKTGRKMDGLIGIQLHLTSTGMKMETRNIRFKEM